MKKDHCERCGKELGYFARGTAIDEPRLGLHYDCVCSSCRKTIEKAVAQVDKMYKRMLTVLKTEYQITTNIGAVDIDTLIFLAVEAVLFIAPDYNKPKTPLFDVIIGRDKPSEDSVRDLSRVVRKVLEYGFSDNLADAELMSFPKYFNNTTLWLTQMQANCSNYAPHVWVNVFLCERGMVFQHVENKEVTSVAFPPDAEIRYATRQQEGLQALNFTSIKYTDRGLADDKTVALYSNDDVMIRRVTRMIDTFNEELRQRNERRRRAVLNTIGEEVRADLRTVFPDTPISSLHIDGVLLCLVKRLKQHSEIPKLDLYDPYGVALDLLVRDYLSNFLTLGIRTRGDMVDYIRSNCLYEENFNVKYENKKPQHAWGFFTSRGYLLCFKGKKRLMFVYEDHYPNDVYYPLNDLIYQGVRYLQLPVEVGKTGRTSAYENFDGIIFFGEAIEILGEMSQYFSRNNRYYQMDRYVAEEKRVYSNRESILEIKRIADRLYQNFGYLPFCLYSELAAIEQEIADGDALMSYLLEAKNDGKLREPRTETSYTGRIVKAFGKGARELMDTLDIMDESVARGILWTYFSKSLIDTLSKEWLRVGEDIANPGESVERAFERYMKLTTIDPDKAYYLGLFIYYLMDLKILPDDDFLINYERVLPVYVRCQQRAIDDSQVEIPAAMVNEAEQSDQTAEADDAHDAHVNDDTKQDTKGDDDVADSLKHSLAALKKMQAEPSPDDAPAKKTQAAFEDDAPRTIDKWAVTTEEAKTQAEEQEKADAEADDAPQTKIVTKKAVNAEGEIVDIEETVPVDTLTPDVKDADNQPAENKVSKEDKKDKKDKAADNGDEKATDSTQDNTGGEDANQDADSQSADHVNQDTDDKLAEDDDKKDDKDEDNNEQKTRPETLHPTKSRGRRKRKKDLAGKA